MKVALSVYGKFHFFHLARQLEQRGLLSHIVSTYPRTKLVSEGIPAEKLKTFPYFHLAWLALSRFRQAHSPLGREVSWWNALSIDAYAKSQLHDADVLVALSGSGLETGRAVQHRGGHYICDRASSHVGYADEILREEFARWNAPYKDVDRRHIAREEQEYAQADVVVVPSEFARRSFIEKGVPAEKVRKVAFGADLSRFTPVAEPNPDVFEVLFVGQVSLRKGIPYLLQAFADFKHPRKRLRVAGTMLPEIDGLLRDGKLPTDQVEFLGSVPHAQLKEIMSSSHVMVLPSIEEGLAYVQGEAMACGCPLISSVHTGAEDLICDGMEGFLVPIRNPQAITDRLEQLAQNPSLRHEMSVAALRLVKSLGGWDEYGAQFVRLLNSLTAPAPPVAAAVAARQGERSGVNL